MRKDPFCLSAACFSQGLRVGAGHRCVRNPTRRAIVDPERSQEVRRACEEVLHRKSSRMTPEECKKFYHATGHRVRDPSDVKKVYARTGLRDSEKGEASYDMIDALKRHAETGEPLSEQHTLAGIDLYGDYAKQKRFDFEERWHQNYARLKAQGVNVDE